MKILTAKKIINDLIKNDFQTTELFLYKLFFVEVFEKGGFDIVIGNPPYVRQEKIKDLKQNYKLKGINLLNGTADFIYLIFYEKGLLIFLKEKWESLNLLFTFKLIGTKEAKILG